ncbi:MAG: sulfatase [Chloroflexi bacterium]|nr:sulfatase [Chloroflexota bacterium]MYC47894.1 sulfatase [Chloroflexota bacterium]
MKAIVVILDSLRRDHVGCYGADSIHTPALDQFSRESIRFNNPKPEALATLQTRRAVHTGNRVFPFGDHQSYKGDINRTPGWGPHSESVVTMAEIARHSGFHTGLITDTYHQFKPSMNFHRGFDQFHWIRGQENDHWGSVQLVDRDSVEGHSYPAQHNEYRRIRFQRYLSNVARRHYEADYFAPQVFTEAMRFVEDNRERDFLLVVDSFDPHEPWDPPWWYVDRYAPGYRGTDLIWPSYGRCEGLEKNQIDLIRALYAGEVTMTDRWLGIFLEHCHCLGIMDETLLVVFSDHGHSLGEHGVMGKLPFSSYPELIDIILMVRPPGGQNGGSSCDPFVYTHDVPATVLAHLGLEAPLAIEGRDLLEIASGRRPGREFAVTGYHNYVVYADSEYWYFSDHGRSDQHLYSLGEDPGCRNNLAAGDRVRCDRFFEICRHQAGGEFPEITPEQLRRAGPWYELV